MINVSVVICTYNRSEELKKTLESFFKQQLSDSLDYELLVVDNHSTDDTRIIADNMAKKHDRIRYVFEEQQGLVYARNRGVNEAKGEIIVFVDDDYDFKENWLTTIVKGFEGNDIDCMGGRIDPVFEARKPKWLVKKLYGVLALINHGEEVFQITDGNYNIVTGNLGVRKEVFSKCGLFDEKLGRREGRLFSGEDTDFVNRVIKGGLKLIYNPDMIVYHRIPEHRLTKKYFRKWNFDTGISYAYIPGIVEVKRTFFNIPRYMVRKFLVFIFKYLVGLILFKRDRFYYGCRIISYVGYFLTMVKLHRKFKN